MTFWDRIPRTCIRAPSDLAGFYYALVVARCPQVRGERGLEISLNPLFYNGRAAFVRFCAAGKVRPMPENIEKYLPDVAHLNLTEQQKIELLRSVYLIMQSFVDRAFGVDPVQQALGYPRVLPLALPDGRVDSKPISDPNNN